jgi:hypothetical protein
MTRSSLLQIQPPSTPTCTNRFAEQACDVQSNNEPVDAGLISVPFWRQKNTPSPIPWVLPSSALGQSPRAKLVHTRLASRAVQYVVHAPMYITLSLPMHEHPLAPSICPAKSSTQSFPLLALAITRASRDVQPDIQQRSGLDQASSSEASSACLPDNDGGALIQRSEPAGYQHCPRT